MTVLRFTYRSGQRPLDGFTLKRGVGQGGFGEVYFAVSDGGKEVALKLIRGQTDAELRGITHCLNLKHPNLVHLYDLRNDFHGEKWVVMEYVFGESLAQVINRHPNGLPTELIREWCAALARGVSYLHDQGVVHRDLKPANIFIEHGHLKIGDYGLSRRMSSSERGELTRGIGTPHYMAPEIKNGNYGRSIDVYASGVILFEMLTGHLPFEGETPAEVLMKHQLDTPDYSKIATNIRPVVQRVLEKDPSKRYATMMEFAKAVEAVLGGERREAVAHPGTIPAPAPTSVPELKLPMAETVVDEPLPLPQISKPPPRKRSDAPGTFRERLAELAAGFTLAPAVAAALTAPCAFIEHGTSWTVLARVFLLATLLAWSLILVGKLSRRDNRNTWSRRAIQLVVGVGVGAMAFWLDGWTVPQGTSSASSRDLILATGHRFSPETISNGLRYLFYFGLTAGACRWWRATDRKRRERVRIFPVLEAGFWGAVFLFLWPIESTPMMLVIAPVMIAAVAVQAASPWAGPPLPIAYPVRSRGRSRPSYA
jgi:eukaryotic-like serine/threonine-protein kinase